MFVSEVGQQHRLLEGHVVQVCMSISVRRLWYMKRHSEVVDQLLIRFIWHDKGSEHS